MTLRITNGRLCLPDGTISQGDLILRDGVIVDFGEPSETIDVRGLFVAPGFIDIHVHGALGRDAMEASPEAFETICRYHAAGGTTTLALTTVCASWKDIGRVLDVAREWQPHSGLTGARLAGVHVEGPYFSAAKRGAHREEFLRVPAADDIDHWTRYTDVISKITLAPELPGARKLIAELTTAGIRTSGGHSDAWGDEADAAFDAGMRQVTHTFNCMSSARRRGAFRVAGLLEAALARKEVICEVIADGYHVEPTLLRMLWAAKGPDHVALITDATAGAGLAIGEEFELGGIPCRVGEGVAFTADGSALAGSTCGMIDCIRTLVQKAGVPLGAAVRAASRTPASALGLESICGTLTPGARADMVVFDEDFRVRQTWVGGRIVYRADDE